MAKLPLLALALMIGSFAEGAELSNPLERFIEDIIMTWKLLSPTIIVKEEIFDLCRTHQWALCVTNNGNVTDLAKHLSIAHRSRKQDSLILVGIQVHEDLLGRISEIEPTILRSKCPVFMPKEYSNMMKLRLDSNIIFYEELRPIKTEGWGAEFKLFDVFAVKGGPEITLELGKWEVVNGVKLEGRLSRWERRVDLHGATLVNGVFPTNWGQLIKDNQSNIVGSQGLFPEKLLYITDWLNLTIKTVELPGPTKLLKNGTWSGAFGFFQRKEIDVDSTGRGINSERSLGVDFPIQMIRNPRTLIAGVPKGTAPNMWVYVRVFGVEQWSIFLALLFLLFIGLTLINVLIKRVSEHLFGTKRGNEPQYQLTLLSGAAILYLYTIQMGSHISQTKNVAIRLLTLTISMLTLVMFVYYNTNITAEMTSGPAPIPVRSFEDVIYHDYSVIVASPFYKNLLATAQPGSAKHNIYKTYIEKEEFMSVDSAFKKVSSEEKVLLYYGLSSVVSKNARPYQGQLIALKMNDMSYSLASLALQKDSEFLPTFNHYILKELEHGIMKRIYRKHHMGFFTNELFGMTDPQALDFNNALFPFVCLGLGVFASCIIAAMEFIKCKWFMNKNSSVMVAWSASATHVNRNNGSRRGAGVCMTSMHTTF